MFGSVKRFILNTFVTRAVSDKILLFFLTFVAIQATYQISTEPLETPQFTYITPPQNVTLGENVSLSCTVDPKGQNITILWKQKLPDNTILTISRNDKIAHYRYKVYADSSFTTFNISIFNIGGNDGGIYFCQIDPYTDISIETQLNVPIPPRKRPNPIVFLDCIVRLPSYEYKVMGRRMNTSEFGSVPYLAMNSSNPSALMLEKITRNDVKKDECAMENVFLVMDIDIETRIAPVIHVCNFNVRYFPDFKAYLECIVECDDGTAPEISWYKDDVRLDQRLDLTNIQSRPIGPLLFFKVRLGYSDDYTIDYGYFSLRVRNEIGEKEITVGFFPTYRRLGLLWSLLLSSFVIMIGVFVITLVRFRFNTYLMDSKSFSPKKQNYFIRLQ